MTNRRIRILIVDDYPAVRAGLRALLESEPDMQVVGEAGNAATAVAQTRLLRPDVILLDMGLPDSDGLRVIQTIRLDEYTPSILVLSNDGEPERVQAALNAGAERYLLKGQNLAAVLTAVRAVNLGWRTRWGR